MRKIFSIVLVISSISCIFLYLLYKHSEIEGNPRIIVIGLDCADWRVIKPLVKDNKLPNIKQLMEKGVSGEIAIDMPLTSEIIWTSIATGKRMDKHGIIDRMTVDSRSGEIIPVTSHMVKAKAIWEILGDNNKKVGIDGYRLTWPPKKFNGIMICGDIPEVKYLGYQAKDRSYPPFAELCTKNEFESFKKLEKSVFFDIDKAKFPNICWWPAEDMDNFVVNSSKFLLTRYKFDAFFIYLNGTDAFAHALAPYLFPDEFNLPPQDIARYKDLLKRYYIWCDEKIGEILKLFGAYASNTVVMLISDHGILVSGGELSFRKMDELLRASEIAEIEYNGKIILLKSDPQFPFSYTKHILINGQLSEAEFKEMRGKVKDIFKKAYFIENKEPIFKDIRETKDGLLLRSIGKMTDPKRSIMLNNKQLKTSDFLISMSNIFKSWPMALHSNSGIIVIAGKPVISRRQGLSIRAYDIVPTILYYMGLPVAKDMDGRVITSVIRRNYFKRHPITYIDTYEKAKTTIVEAPKRMNSSEEEAKKKMLRSLGYLN